MLVILVLHDTYLFGYVLIYRIDIQNLLIHQTFTTVNHLTYVQI